MRRQTFNLTEVLDKCNRETACGNQMVGSATETGWLSGWLLSIFNKPKNNHFQKTWLSWTVENSLASDWWIQQDTEMRSEWKTAVICCDVIRGLI